MTGAASGALLAQFEMKLVLGTILSSWRLTPADRRPMKPVRRGVFAGPPPDMRLVPVERHSTVGEQGH